MMERLSQHGMNGPKSNNKVIAQTFLKYAQIQYNGDVGSCLPESETKLEHIARLI